MQLPQLKTSLNNLIRHSTKSVSVADVSLPHLTVTNDLYFVIYSEIKSKWNKELSELRLKRISYYYSEYLIDVYAKNQDCSLAINYLVKKRIINRLDKQKYAQICKIIESKNQNNDLLVVQSIESVKGLESDNCLFVLTTDLAPYLFRNRSTTTPLPNHRKT